MIVSSIGTDKKPKFRIMIGFFYWFNRGLGYELELTTRTDNPVGRALARWLESKAA